MSPVTETFRSHCGFRYGWIQGYLKQCIKCLSVCLSPSFSGSLWWHDAPIASALISSQLQIQKEYFLFSQHFREKSTCRLIGSDRVTCSSLNCSSHLGGGIFCLVSAWVICPLLKQGLESATSKSSEEMLGYHYYKKDEWMVAAQTIDVCYRRLLHLIRQNCSVSTE